VTACLVCECDARCEGCCVLFARVHLHRCFLVRCSRNARPPLQYAVSAVGRWFFGGGVAPSMYHLPVGRCWGVVGLVPMYAASAVGGIVGSVAVGWQCGWCWGAHGAATSEDVGRHSNAMADCTQPRTWEGQASWSAPDASKLFCACEE
jgi:hypothetical protein